MARKRKSTPLPEKMPTTIDEAVDFALTSFGEDSLKLFRRIETEDELLNYGITLSMDVRSGIGIWGRNTELLATLPPEIASKPVKIHDLILVAIWKRIKNNPELKPHLSQK